ncbi:MAG TPA: hypothetical protein DIV46_07960 [Verrucomicrobiales bacterium]|jgi:hypothetical protein|nr:hypothetical protein [Verrucomicrobiales bacterium]|tara:strand:+ start:1925 stop:2842 length:918 start_codon:yes stop_codon:yes gene_type:complete
MKTSMLKSITLTSLALHAAILPFAAAQDVVSINLMQNFVAAQTVDPNVPYGVEEVPFWTNSNGNSPLNLRDQTGTPTTLNLTIANGGRNLFGGNSIGGTPMKAGQAFFIAGAGPSFTFSEIPYANYKVVAYLTGYNATNTQASISDGSTTYWWRPQPYGPALNQTTDTDASDGIDQASYAVFGTDENPLTGSSFTLQALLGSSATAGAGIGGFQIVEILVANNPPPPTLNISKNGLNYDFQWDSSSGKVYDLVSAPDLSQSVSTWEVYQSSLMTYENIAASSTGTNALTGVAATGEKQFFALRVR